MSAGTKMKWDRVPLTFDTATTVQEGSDVPFNSARAHKLISDQIGVVGGRDVIFRKWAGHVHPDRWFFAESGVLLGRKKRDKMLDFPFTILPGDRRRGL